ncbi:hypothetical protein LZ198_32380 [Myxococcus sp. K15C18031901]|uniref:hypothetical protein n=1 Tax=Myxococcus dinghuensis TaxID=2906761 RepID=UPI0020A70881|nr:hypothetical protein [Myxococcus dinghuensis]MCP3103591.1 hypothetical protein [Myxococcus dinghuensis]
MRRRAPGPHPIQGSLASGPWVLTLCLLLVVPMRRAEAYPISPVPLWELTERAGLVVWADVEGVEEVPRSAEDKDNKFAFLDESVATLRIREVWKGTAQVGERIGVSFSPTVICPAPPRYEPGLAVVAFLEQDQGRWRTVALSHGTRYPADAVETESYRQAVTRAHRAQVHATSTKEGSPPADLARLHLDWSVFAATQPALRWDALYDLLPQSDTNHFFYDQRPAKTAPNLTQAHRKQLADGFVKDPPTEEALPMLLAALRGFANDEVDAAATSALETLFNPPGKDIPLWTRLAFDLLRERLGEKVERPSDLLEDRTLTTMPQEELHHLARQWEQFKQRHHLKPAPHPPLQRKPLVSGTGGDTPP